MVSEWAKRKAVGRMQDFIEAHLNEPVTLSDLASASRYSMYHSARMFKELTGRTPFEYLRMRRLSAAAVELDKDGRRVVDVAFDFVFDSHEGFTRAFARQFGVPPSRLQEVAWPAHLFHPAPATEFYRERQKGVVDMTETADNKQRASVVFVQILERPAASSSSCRARPRPTTSPTARKWAVRCGTDAERNPGRHPRADGPLAARQPASRGHLDLRAGRGGRSGLRR